MTLLANWQALRDHIMADMATIAGLDTILELENQNDSTAKDAIGFARLTRTPIDTPTIGGHISPKFNVQIGGYIKSTDASQTGKIKDELYIAFFDWLNTQITNNDDFGGTCYIIETPKEPVVTGNEVSLTFKVQLPE